MSRSSRLRRPLALLAIATVSSAGLAACGGSDVADTTVSTESTSTTTASTASTAGGAADAPALSSAEFVTRANAICAEGNAAIESLFADVPPGTEPSAEQQQALKAALLENVGQQVDDIESLGVPTEIEGTVGPFITGARTTIEQAGAQSPEEFFGAGNPFAAVNDLAVAAGLTICGA